MNLRKLLFADSLFIYEKLLIWLVAIVCFSCGFIMLVNYFDPNYYRKHLANLVLLPGVVFISLSVSLVFLMRYALILLFYITFLIGIALLGLQISMLEKLDWLVILTGIISFLYSAMLANIFIRYSR